MLIAQITDFHIVEPGGRMADRIDPSVGLAAAIDMINGLDPIPDLVLATGDLVNDGLPAQYDQLLRLLERLSVPVLPIPGNHDDRTEMRHRFPQLPAGGPDDPIDYAVDDHAVRMIGLDTSIPGDRNDGLLTAAQLDWLDRQLAAAPDSPTVIFQHHPPFPSGLPWMDEQNGFADPDHEAAVLRRHPQVEAVLCGHFHRSIHRRFGGTIASSCPSTAVQMVLDMVGDTPAYTGQPAALMLHHFADGALNSHVVPVAMADQWTPSWA
jgi:3',5'-cyclic AMP phosphodiesterase CpdA